MLPLPPLGRWLLSPYRLPETRQPYSYLPNGPLSEVARQRLEAMSAQDLIDLGVQLMGDTTLEALGLA